MTSTKQRRTQDALRREIERGIAKAAAPERKPAPPSPLLSALRNVNRTTTAALDAAGVPDRLQGAGQEDWYDDLEDPMHHG